MTILACGFLASHGGSSMQAIIDACKDGRLTAKPCVVTSNDPDCTGSKNARIG